MTILLHENDFFKTTDLALATVIFLSCPLEAIDRSGRKAAFIFKRTTELDELIQSYWRRELKVEPIAYFEALRLIKARLYGAD